MRISDWSSDVCSSDLLAGGLAMGALSLMLLQSRVAQIVLRITLSAIFAHPLSPFSITERSGAPCGSRPRTPGTSRRRAGNAHAHGVRILPHTDRKRVV